ncbi:ArsR family transcriptional regulator [Halomicronema hongdechloris C2206]|uniref:ArsR family transcriptional regulator n=1 Tax=Halomicronema hongdechloris C2206 TaxID=1641165 RepID=A0A1Z3HJ28_9CYAN|nr:metalloregulator ArsR/SmtB family transcription factor [Halomicronema hongdechloris]ASC70266.1 ArsR family transcriptional regulator [Halomicronema hongdechloris C2206]
MSQADFQTLLAFFKALSNESRLKLVGLLAQSDRSVEELAALLHLKEPTVSHHLAKLKALDLVEMRSQGNTHLYRLNQEALHSLSKAVLISNHAELVADLDGDAWEEKVLRNYVEAGRLREIPASRKKRWVILKWLVQQFECDRTYSEVELNQHLKQFHPDVATLRREFIGYQMMQRQQGNYWRLPEAQWRREPNQQVS